MSIQAILDRNVTYNERLVVRALAKAFPQGGIVSVSQFLKKIGMESSRATAISAMRKLALAGVVSTRSLGRKGTLIRVLDEERWQAFAEED